MVRDLRGPSDKELVAKRRTVKVWNDQEEARKFKGTQFIKVKHLRTCSPRPWVSEMFRRAERGARSRSLDFDLSMDDLVHILRASSGRCTVTGVVLRHDRIDGNYRIRRPYAPSLDRIDSSKGCSLDNCRIVCAAANMAMGQWGEEVLLEMAKSLAKRRLRAV